MYFKIIYKLAINIVVKPSHVRLGQRSYFALKKNLCPKRSYKWDNF